MSDPFVDKRDPLVRAMTLASIKISIDKAVRAERERCAEAIKNHPGFSDDEKRIAVQVILSTS